MPGDKSLSHRALLFAAIADGTTKIEGLSASADVGSTIAALRALGVRVDGEPPADVVVHGRGVCGLSGPDVTIDCGDSGTTMRLLAGLLAGQRRPFTLDGSPALRRRPMRRIIEPLRTLGADVTAEADGRPPIRGGGEVGRDARPELDVESDPVPEPESDVDPDVDSRPEVDGDPELAVDIGPDIAPRLDVDAEPDVDVDPKLIAAHFDLERASAQVGSAILLAALNAAGETIVRYPGPVRDHTERLLQAMGAPLSRDGLETRLAGPVDRLKSPGDGLYSIAPDPSGAAFALAAAAIVPGSRVSAIGINVNPGRVGLFEIMRRMGARIAWQHGPERFGEPTADIEVAAGPLMGIEVGAELVPIAIDELPLFAVVATQAEGRSVLRDAAELRLKECDRIAAMVDGLGRMGARITERPDGFEVEGPTRLQGATVDGRGDHRIVMALTIAGLVADGETIVTDGDRPADSYPGFVTAIRALGAWIDRVDISPDASATSGGGSGGRR